MLLFQLPLIGSRELIQQIPLHPQIDYFSTLSAQSHRAGERHILCLFKWIICLINFQVETLRIHQFN